MISWRQAGAALTGLIMAGACGIDDIDFTGKTCTSTCPTGYACVSGMCQKGTGLTLRVAWTTPNTIRWAWTVNKELLNNFSSYELEVKTTSGPDAGKSRIWTLVDNPELGFMELPFSGGVDAVLATMTDEHSVNTLYTGTLTLKKSSGAAVLSNPATAHTRPQTQAYLRIFDDQRVSPGYSLPGSFKLVTGPDGYANSTTYLEATRTTNDPDYWRDDAGVPLQGPCYENLRRQDVGVSTDNVNISPELFASDDVYLELAVSATRTDSWYSDVWLYFQEGAAPCVDTDSCIYRLSGWTIRPDGKYRLIQVPLHVLANAGVVLPYAIFQHGVRGFNVGGNWKEGATIRVDRVRIAY